MLRSLYSAVSAMITLENKQNTVTNNITNANNTGYKAEDMTVKSFDDVMIQNKDKIIGNTNVTQKIGKLSLGAEMDTVVTKFTQGDLKQSDSNTDFAIDGRGFFVVQTGNTESYTRDGSFLVDNTGYLVTTTGDRVLGVNNSNGETQPIYIGKGKNFKVDTDNKIYIDGVSTQTMKTADFADYKTLNKISDNYYSGQNPIYNAKVSVNQGYLESSNVNASTEMVNMITVMRNFESAQKCLNMIDDTLGIAATKVGKV